MSVQNGSVPELLAPAGSPEALEAALRCGADAVYLGAKQFSARANAENFDFVALSDAARQCRLYGAKLYLAINTLIFEEEFAALDALLQNAAEIGADGCIVQDLGAAAYIAKRLPTLRLHASTQLTIHTPAGVRFAKLAGFCRVVAARELSREQLSAVCQEARRCGLEVEAFVHGAHCMCVSGQCLMSAAMGGRSANRGACAQPCRLPFSADSRQRDYCALSLKDLSLTAHLREMCAMGVQSLKIEGRMKRPEYVAAAVTACRAALDGKEPDIETLQAVFSRSGFTDGYYTGRRQDMFGMRTKTDVTAAQGVLPKLRTLYQNPRKCAVLNAHYTLRAGEPAELVVYDDAGNSAAVSGEIPQTAQTRETGLPQLTQSFQKLGGTIYTAGTVSVDAAPGLMLPAAALNSLRRSAVEEMDALRIKQNGTVHHLQDAPKIIKNTDYHEQPEYRLQIRRMEQLSVLGELADEIAYLLLPLQFAEAEQKLFPRERCILLAPRFVCDETKIINLLHHAKELGYTRLGVQQPGDLAVGQALGFTLHGTLGMHIANSFAAEKLRDLGLRDGLLSPELPAQALADAPLPLGYFAYGKLPLMLTRNCPVKAQVGCGKCKHLLKDRKGAEVYTDCTRLTEKPDYAELFNAVPVWTADRSFPQKQRAFALLAMTNEAPEQVRAVAEAYLRGAKSNPPAHFTRGLRVG